jgi:hypothetical protein
LAGVKDARGVSFIDMDEDVRVFLFVPPFTSISILTLLCSGYS